jgi:hypothetical protein
MAWTTRKLDGATSVNFAQPSGAEYTRTARGRRVARESQLVPFVTVSVHGRLEPPVGRPSRSISMLRSTRGLGPSTLPRPKNNRPNAGLNVFSDNGERCVLGPGLAKGHLSTNEERHGKVQLPFSFGTSTPLILSLDPTQRSGHRPC